VLAAFGYDASQFHIKLQVRNVAIQLRNITKAHTHKRQDAVAKNAETQGGLFQKTGGSTVNGDDIFIAAERTNLQEQLDKLTSVKEKQYDILKVSAQAQEILVATRPGKDFTSTQIRHLIAWMTGKPCPSPLKNKDQHKKRWDELKDGPTPEDAAWTPQDDETIKDDHLKARIENLPIADTLLARKKMEALQMLFVTLPTLSREEKVKARTMLSGIFEEVTNIDTI
jgi:hypothetical protein